jgi:integrase
VRELVKQIALDPIGYKNRRDKTVTDARVKTCGELFPVWIEYLRKARHYTNEKNYEIVASRLETYARPVIGKMLPDEITQDHVKQILEATYNAGHGGAGKTSDKIRGHVKQFIDWCADEQKVRDPDKPNPAADGQRLMRRLARADVSAPRRHQPMCPLEDMQRFVMRLTDREIFHSGAAMGLLFMILTCSRHGNIARQVGSRANYAVWEDMDLSVDGREVWRIPYHKMKEGANGDHVVPLSRPAVAILRRLEALGLRDATGPVFHNGRGDAFSNGAFKRIIQQVSQIDKACGGSGFLDNGPEHRLMTPHGTARGTFRSWVTNQGKDVELAELCLHHSLGKVRDAYQHDPAVERRRVLLEEWADWCLALCPADWAKLP